ncbi:hypothetical protein HZU77_002445 [Neisseriaceae bacterium TC5R-5]|nr:hypothetical protein [Neisseriaceae bacterium TC5R-5]
MSRLNTFVAPNPNPALMQRLVTINRWFNLHGLPLLRDLPLLKHVPGFSGLTNIRHIHLPAEHAARLQASLLPQHACFVAPNHPEFFTDWMLDKELSARYAPQLASWATHNVVNGMGAWMQRFWLRNNLIAQIPGSGGQAAKNHSVQWALQGHGVLLHPEGSVNWHADWIAPLFNGVAELALAAQQQQRQHAIETVIIQPVIWKLRFLGDQTPAIGRELIWTAKRLRIDIDINQSLTQQLQQLLYALLQREASAAGIKVSSHTSVCYFEERAQVLVTLSQQLQQLSQGVVPNLLPPRRWQRALRECDDSQQKKMLQQRLRSWERLQRVAPEAYNTVWLAQEHIAECVKRIRQDYCHGSWRDTVNAYCPRPVGPREVHLRVPEAIRLNSEEPADPQALTRQLRRSMQAELDQLLLELHAKQPYWTLHNPLYCPTLLPS